MLPVLGAVLVFVTAEVMVLALIAHMLGWSLRRAWAGYRDGRKQEPIICNVLTDLDRETVADLICRYDAA